MIVLKLNQATVKTKITPHEPSLVLWEQVVTGKDIKQTADNICLNKQLGQVILPRYCTFWQSVIMSIPGNEGEDFEENLVLYLLLYNVTQHQDHFKVE